MTGDQRPLGQGTVADLAPAGTAHEAGLAHAERRELVVVHEALGFLDVEPVDALLVASGAQGEQSQHLGLAPGEEARAMGARSDAHVAVDRPDLVDAATVGPLLVDGDGTADALLLDGVEGLGTAALPRRSRRRSASAGGQLATTSCLSTARASARSCLSSTLRGFLDLGAGSGL